MKNIIFVATLILLQTMLLLWGNLKIDYINIEKNKLFKKASLLYSAPLAQPSISDPYQDPDDPQNKIWPVPNCKATYYVDYDNGSDMNIGTSSAAAWKHCPGDANAAGISAKTALKPGNVISFRGGVVYRGSIQINKGGSPKIPIFFEGSCWDSVAGKAIIDGSEVLTGWTKCKSTKECANNTNWKKIYYTNMPATMYRSPFTANLHENDDYLWLAQHPNMPDPYFWDDISNYLSLPIGSMTSTALTDAHTDSAYWQNASVALWVTPNLVQLRNITNVNPTAHTLSWSESVTPYKDRVTKYSIINSMQALDQSGEYYINPEAEPDGTHKVYLWPRDINNLTRGITISIRRYGIDIASSYVTIEGFRVQKFSGSSTTDGIGIGTFSSAHLTRSHITIRNNDIRHNRHTVSGYGGIYLSRCDTSLVENNILFENMKHCGIYIPSSHHVIVRNNTITRPGGTAIVFFGNENSQIVGNTIADSNGRHANGITLYLGCYNVLIAWNKITNCRNSITYQDSGNLYFYRNFIDANGYSQCVNDWGGNKKYRSGTISFLNNTFVGTKHSTLLGIGVWDKNINVVINNIIDGATGKPAAKVDRSNNIYTSLSFNQKARYGWALGDHERLITDLDTIFSDPENADYHLRIGSPAINTGADITRYLPITMFPHVNFWKDIDGISVPSGQFDLGAYAGSTTRKVNKKGNIKKLK